MTCFYWVLWCSSIIRCFHKRLHTKSLCSLAGHHLGVHRSQYKVVRPLSPLTCFDVSWLSIYINIEAADFHSLQPGKRSLYWKATEVSWPHA